MIKKLRNWLGTWGLIAGMALATAALAGCASGGSSDAYADVETGPTGGGGTAPSGSGPNYASTEVLSPGDLLTITVTDLPGPQPMMLIEEKVKDDGTITLMHNQTFQAGGKRAGDVEKEIRSRYVPRLYVNMTVSVKAKESTRFYFVGGEVKQPGRQVYVSRLTVLGAIQSAGDFTDFARKSRVQLIRANGQKFTINAPRALVDPKLDLEVFPGDKVHVPRRPI